MKINSKTDVQIIHHETRRRDWNITNVKNTTDQFKV